MDPEPPLRVSPGVPTLFCTIWYMPVILLENLQQFAAVNLLSDPGRIAGPKVIPSAAMVRINWNFVSGKVGHNVLYATFNGTPALSTSLADAIKAAITTGAAWTALAGFMHTGASLAGITLLDVRDAVHSEINSTTAAVPGTSATTTAIPDEVAICVTLRTASRGPSGRGRMYLGGFAGNAIQNTPGIVSGLVTAGTNWSELVRTTITSQLGAQVLGLPARAAYTSALTGRVFPARAATTIPVTQAIVRNNTWDSQRRRGLK